MAFNILSCVMVYIFSSILWTLLFDKKKEKDKNDEMLAFEITVTIVFAWVMSWQNWWR